VLRSKSAFPDEARRKIALFTNVEATPCSAPTTPTTSTPCPRCSSSRAGALHRAAPRLERVTPELRVWQEAVRVLRQPEEHVSIGVVGKYVAMPDAYLSLMEALKHAGIANRARVDIDWVSAEAVADGDVEQLAAFDGILVPGGFGVRGIEGKVRAARFARERGVPYLGICLGMQVAVIEFARTSPASRPPTRPSSTPTRRTRSST
jgi:CTP synthase